MTDNEFILFDRLQKIRSTVEQCGNCRLNAHKVVDKCIIEDRVDNDCPLIPVPEHGRLIDADALMKKGMPLSFSVQKWVQEVDIACAPTIIPADKEGER